MVISVYQKILKKKEIFGEKDNYVIIGHLNNVDWWEANHDIESHIICRLLLYILI